VTLKEYVFDLQHLNHMLKGAAQEERVVKEYQAKDDLKNARKENKVAILAG